MTRDDIIRMAREAGITTVLPAPLGQVESLERFAALIAAAEHGLAICEYAPREIKQAAVGRGAAAKEQVAFMIRSMLRLKETPPADAADALAVAITHFQSSDAHRITAREARRC